MFANKLHIRQTKIALIFQNVFQLLAQHNWTQIGNGEWRFAFQMTIKLGAQRLFRIDRIRLGHRVLIELQWKKQSIRNRREIN